MGLKTITVDKLSFTGEITADGIIDDRIPTWLYLGDYDWMCYRLKTIFTTKELGELTVVFEFSGCQKSSMEVKQIVNNITQNFEYEFSTELFKKHIVIFLEKHIESWDEYYAFNGEKEVLSFYNDVIECGKLVKEEMNEEI